MNCRDFFCVGLVIKQLALENLSYQPAFNSIISSYLVYESTIGHNQSYVKNYHLDRIMTNKQTKTSDSDFYQARIV